MEKNSLEWEHNSLTIHGLRNVKQDDFSIWPFYGDRRYKMRISKDRSARLDYYYKTNRSIHKGLENSLYFSLTWPTRVRKYRKKDWPNLT